MEEIKEFMFEMSAMMYMLGTELGISHVLLGSFHHSIHIIVPILLTQVALTYTLLSTGLYVTDHSCTCKSTILTELYPLQCGDTAQGRRHRDEEGGEGGW